MAALADRGRSRAVLIGVSGYRRMARLPAVAGNLRDLAGLLTDPDVGGLPADNCVVVEDPQSSSALLEPVHEAARAATDLLVVYFAGHGLLDETGELYLALPDGSRDRLPFAVRFTELRREVVGTARRCRAKVVVLDCCFSGRAMSGFMAGAGRLADQAAVEGAYLMTATAETVAALAPVGARHTAFTGALIETLRDGVPGGPPLLDMETVFGAVEQRLRARGQPMPQRRSREAGHRITIARNRAAGLPAPAEPPVAAPRWTGSRLVLLAGLGVTLAAALAGLLRNDRHDAGREPHGATSPATSPAVAPATDPTPTPTLTPTPMLTPTSASTADELTVNLFGPAKGTPDGVVKIRVTEVGNAVKFFVVTPEKTCRVVADIGDSTVIRRPSGRWVRIIVSAAKPAIGEVGDESFTIPVEFSVERGTGTPPTGNTPCA